MAGPFADTFVEGSDVELSTHTPTGPNAGTAWVGLSGTINVIAATDLCEEQDFLSSNQYTMNNDLGFDEMDVQADITRINAVSRVGLRFRLPAPPAVPGWEAGYDEANTKWYVTDGTTTQDSVEAWDGATITIMVECRANISRLYANGVLKVTHNSNAFSGNRYAGIHMLNFDGSGPNHRLDNFSAVGVPVVKAASDITPTGQSDASQPLTVKIKATEG